jgi:hypothetical protein
MNFIRKHWILAIVTVLVAWRYVVTKSAGVPLGFSFGRWTSSLFFNSSQLQQVYVASQNATAATRPVDVALTGQQSFEIQSTQPTYPDTSGAVMSEAPISSLL